MDRSIALTASPPFAAAPGMLEDALMHRSPRLLLTAVVTSTRCPGLTSRIQQALVLVCAAVACRCRSCVPHLRPSCARVLDPKPVRYTKISDSAQDHTWAHSRHTEPAHTTRRAKANRRPHSTLHKLFGTPLHRATLVELLLAHARGASPHAGALFEVMVHRMYHSTHPSGKRSTLSGKGSEKRHL